jgi:transcriptional regulator NrdR family protein
MPSNIHFNASCACPNCGSTFLKTKATYYTDKGERVRYKRCQECSCQFSTIQESENILDPLIYIRHTNDTKHTKVVSLSYRDKNGVFVK